MSLSFTVSGPMVRPFLNMLSCAAKIGETVCLVAYSSCIELSAVSASCTEHLVMTIPALLLEQYCTTPLPAAEQQAVEEEEGRSAVMGNEAAALRDFFLCISAKALFQTVLRQNVNALQAVHVRCNAAESQVSAAVADAQRGFRHKDDWRTNFNNAADRVCVDCVFMNGIIRSFVLHLASGSPCSVATRPTGHYFELAADAKVLGGLLAFLPRRAARCVLYALPSCLELRCADSNMLLNNNTNSGSSGQHAGSADTAIIHANPQQFQLFRHIVLDEHGRMVSEAARGSGDAADIPSQSHVQEQQQQQQQQHREGGGSDAGTRLPGKMVDVRPLRNVALLAGQLNVLVDVLCGGRGAPLIVRSVLSTAEGGQTRQAMAEQEPGSAIAFVLHLAAFDVPYPEGTTTTTTVTTTIANTGSHAHRLAGTDEASIHISTLASTAGAGNSVRGPSLTPSHEPALSAHDSRRTAAAAAATPDVQPRVRQQEASSQAVPSMADTHVTASYVSASTPSQDNAGAHEASHATATVSQRLSAVAADALVVMPSAEESNKQGGGGTDTPCTSSAVAGVHGVPAGMEGAPVQPVSSLLVQPSTQNTPMSHDRGAPGASCGDVAPSANSGRPELGRCSLAEMYPLDFDAFANNAGGDDVEDALVDDEDAELQRFLESCSALLVNGTLSQGSVVASMPSVVPASYQSSHTQTGGGGDDTDHNMHTENDRETTTTTTRHH